MYDLRCKELGGLAAFSGAMAKKEEMACGSGGAGAGAEGGQRGRYGRLQHQEFALRVYDPPDKKHGLGCSLKKQQIKNKTTFSWEKDGKVERRMGLVKGTCSTK